MFQRVRTERLWAKAAGWHARMAEPRSAQEVAEFEAWLARDPRHAEAYAEMDAVMAAARSVPSQAEPTRRAATSVLRPALAFGLVVVAIFGVAVLWQGASAPAFATMSNSGPAVRGVQLSDGTQVWLDVGAAIGVRLTDGHREIEVREGRIRVVPASTGHPVVIISDTIRIEPGRTRTDVTVDGGALSLGALDGAVSVESILESAAWIPQRVAAGRAMVYDKQGNRPVVLEPFWTASRLRFSSEPLRGILALANRVANPDIAVESADLAALRVSGVFDLRDTRRLARKLAATLDLRVTEDTGKLTLRK